MFNFNRYTCNFPVEQVDSTDSPFTFQYVFLDIPILRTWKAEKQYQTHQNENTWESSTVCPNLIEKESRVDNKTLYKVYYHEYYYG